MEREEFNALGVSAPLPGKAAVDYPAAKPVAQEPPPPEPQPVEEPQAQEDPRTMIEEAMNQQPVRRPQSFAEKRKLAEIEEEQRRNAALAEIERIEGLAQLGNMLEQNPVLAQRLAQAYEEVVEGQQVAPTYSPPARQPSAEPRSREEIAQLSQKLAQMERVQGIQSVHAANQIVQGRHHLKQEDMARIVEAAIQRGLLHPGMNTVQAEQVLEDMRKVVLFDRARTDGKRDFVDQLDKKAQAAASTGAAGGSARQSYTTQGKSFADIRRDAKAAGARGL